MANKAYKSILNFIKKTNKQEKLLCYAPFYSLLIEQQGNLKVCCHNVSYILGRYPNDTIADAWFGKQRKDIIDCIKQDIIPDSCKDCIRNGLSINLPEILTEKKAKRAIMNFNNFPLQIDFMIDNTCNLDCIMCNPHVSSSSTYPMPFYSEKTRFEDGFFEQIKPFLKNGKFFVFSGGEPFLIPMYLSMWAYISETNKTASIYVQTNGTILNENIRSIIKEYNLSIGVSIDSLKKEVYETIRRNASFEKTFENLNFFIQHSHTIGQPMTIITTPMIYNATEIPGIVDFCNKNKITFTLSLLERPAHLAIWSLPSIEINKIIVSNQRATFPGAADSPIINKNIATYNKYIKILQNTAKQKKYLEDNSVVILKNIKKRTTYVKENFENYIRSNINKYSLSEEEKKRLFNRIMSISNSVFQKHSLLFKEPDMLYSYFIQDNRLNGLSNLSNHSDEEIEILLDIKMKELKVLFDTNSYDRIIDIDVNE
ncbi:MAG TPA: radical SAM protein [Bacteroidales bacterium]|nr:radical SAM protein [Bacteroidales bacterium]